MPVYEITSPDGRKFRVTAPDGATPADVMAYVQKSSVPKAKEAPLDPTEGMSTLDKIRAGFGKAIVDTGRGIADIATLGGYQKEIDEAKKYDAPLMDTGAGMVGNVGGNLATMVGPSAAVGMAGKAAQIPVMVNAARSFMLPKTVAGAIGQGVGMGAIQPVASDDSRMMNMGLGGTGAAIVPGAIAGGRAVKSLVDPFTGSGRERIAGRALERFAANPQSILQSSAQELVPGSMPTLAEATQDVGLAQLQRSLRNNPDANNAITQRFLQQNEARMGALQNIAGDPGQREFFDESRRTAARELYGKAMQEQPVDTPWVKGQISQLLKRPTFRQAWKEASEIALDDGLKLDRSNVVQVSHYTKLALDRKIEGLADKPEAQKAVVSIKDKLVSLMESKNFAPSYREARATYAEMSKPINQMDVGQSLVEKLQPALAEFGATGRTTPAKYAQALRDGDATARRATGFRGATLEGTLSPGQLGAARDVARDLGRSANAQELGMARGSPTGQNFVSQDILRQVLGPFGLPKSFSESTLAETLLRPVSFAYKAPEARVMGLLGDASLDPKKARELLLKELAKRKRGADHLIPYGAGLGTAGLLGLTQ